MQFNITRQETLFIKGIAILFVILSHMGLFDCGGTIGVHLFLIVSGYGIYCSYKKMATIRTGNEEYLLYICHIYFQQLFYY